MPFYRFLVLIILHLRNDPGIFFVGDKLNKSAFRRICYSYVLIILDTFLFHQINIFFCAGK